MRGLLAPSYEQGGLAVPPRKKQCVSSAGIDCPVAEKQNRCFISRHHLYFPAYQFDSSHPEYKKLRENEFAIVSMAHCRHHSSYGNSWHNTYRKKTLPKLDYAARFNEESEILRMLEVSVAGLGEIVTKLISNDPKKQATIMFREAEHEEWLLRHSDNADFYLGMVGEIEVMPSTIVGSVVTSLCERRANLDVQQALARIA